MRNETCPICRKPTVQAQCIVRDTDDWIKSVWLCEVHNRIRWQMAGYPTLDEIKAATPNSKKEVKSI